MKHESQRLRWMFFSLMIALPAAAAVQQETYSLRLVSVALPQPLTQRAPVTDISTFELEIDKAGAVTGITLLRGQSAQVDLSRESLKEWTFNPTESQQARRRVSATFLYKAQTALPDGTTTVTVPLPPGHESAQSPIPVEIVIPGYPVGGISEGAVILQGTIGPAGEVQHVEVIHRLPSLTDAAVQAFREWKFAPRKTASQIATVMMWFNRPEYS
jgi:hypothetical protein